MTGIIERYRDFIDLATHCKIITLHEGNTPLIPCINLPKLWDFNLNLYIKYEGLNPTGSFKDRGMTVAVTQAIHEGSRAILCASTGNTSAAASAYAARAGIRSVVLIPKGNIAMGKLAQAMMHGATIVQIAGNFDQGMQLVKELSTRLPITLVNSINPYRLQGQKTAAFEIVDTLGQAPDFHCLPVGNAGNISAYWMGYTEYHSAGRILHCPKMLGYQASGAAPLIAGKPVAHPETVATAIRIGNPQSWDKAINVQQSSGGWFKACPDEAILAAQRLLATHEGIFCEPASAASIAGLQYDIQAGHIPAGSTVVCTVTGHGLKDPDVAMQQCSEAPLQTEPELSAVQKVIEQLL